MSMPGQAASKINIGELLENSPIGPLQIRVFLLCMICLIMDGFDVQAMGYVAPAIVEDWGIPRALLGGVFAAANFGVLLGSLVFSMVADKIGRRPVLIGATLFFSVMAIATAYAQNVHPIALAAVHRRDRHGLHHAECHGAHRRVQPEAQSRDVHDVHHRRLHRGRGARRIRRGLDDPGFRLAVGVHLWRSGSAGDCAGDGLGPP